MSSTPPADDYFSSATPPPETDGLNEPLQQIGDFLVEVKAARGKADAAEAQALSAAFLITEQRSYAERAEHPGRGAYAELFRHNLRSIMGSYGALLNLSDTALIARAHAAHRLTSKFPSWLEPLRAGEVSKQQVDSVLRHSKDLPDEVIDSFGEQVLNYAKNHLPGKTEKYAERLAARHAASEFEANHAREVKERRVVIQDVENGMSWLSAYLPSSFANAAFDLLTTEAKILRDENKREIAEHKASNDEDAAGTDSAEFLPDERTIEQIRADLLLDTLLTSTPQGILESKSAGKRRVEANISIVVPVLALRDPEAPRDIATLNGTQPMSVDEARDWFGDVPSIERILTAPINGHVITADTRVATASLTRYLRARDQTCRHPGCRRPAAKCELDHTVPWEIGGKTMPENLQYLCKRHHIQKHRKPWRVRHLGGGVLEWTSPLGHVFIDYPEPMGPVLGPEFKYADDPAPF
jgi:hypothetical protein